MRYRDVPLAADRRRDRLPILLSPSEEWEGMPRLLALARKRNWRLLNLLFRRGDVPEGLEPAGALVSQLPSHGLVRKLLGTGTPVVRIGSLPHPKDALVPAVMPDWPAAGRLAAQHFAERGFKHLGYIGYKPWGVGRAMYDGFKAGAEDAGCDCHLLRLQSGEGELLAAKYRRRREEIGEWLGTVPRPLGLLGYKDRWAATLCAMLRDLGIAVPEQVAILGYGDDQSATIGSWPTLSSIVPDHERVAEMAVSMLETLMAGRKLRHTTVRIPPLRVVVRESTDVLAVADPDVAKALRYIWDHIDLDLSVNRIAREVGVSRRTLEREFRRGLGRTINVEIRRKRLEQLQLLLRTTDTRIADLAPMVGFHSPQYLHRAFRKAFGISPREYRMRCRGTEGSTD